MFAFSQNFCITWEYLHSLTKPLCSLTKVLQSLRKFVFVHKTSAFSPKNIAFPDKLCICSQNLSVLSQKYRIPRENFSAFAFGCKTFAYPEHFAFVYKIFVFFTKVSDPLAKFCSLTKCVHRLRKIIKFPVNLWVHLQKHWNTVFPPTLCYFHN